MKKIIFQMAGYSILATVILPFLVTLCFRGLGVGEIPQQTEALYGVEDLAVLTEGYDAEEQEAGAELESELEQYVAGVVAAEMPAAFPLEALKAQAVAARTYQIQQQKAAGSEEILYDVGQAYCTLDEQKEKWGRNYAFYSKKVRQAVRETAGEIMVYDGEPILAAFHAQSGGRTEDAENVWSRALPYLKSVDSAEDQNAPNHEMTVRLPAKKVLSALCGEKADGSAELSILRRTEAGTVAQVQVGTVRLSGREVREKLGLRSANFTVKRQGDQFLFTTYGYGHGAGMSQYGASFLAEKGKNYREILKHYYTGIAFEKIGTT